MTAELPGFGKKDVRLDVDGGGPWIRAYRQKAEEAPQNGRWVRRERSSQAYERYVPLPDEVSPDGVRATFRNGVLEVAVPKTSPEKRRRRSIEID